MRLFIPVFPFAALVLALCFPGASSQAQGLPAVGESASVSGVVLPSTGTNAVGTNTVSSLTTPRVISAEELRAMLSGTNDFVLVDVMPKLFFRDYHITGAMSIPEPELAATVRDWTRDRRIVVYCLDRECVTSRDAARTLLKMGFKDVLQYEGGKREWHAKKYEGTGKAKLLD